MGLLSIVTFHDEWLTMLAHPTNGATEAAHRVRITTFMAEGA
jgi:hypothetical protein